MKKRTHLVTRKMMMNERSYSLPKVIFLSANIPLFNYKQPSPFVLAQQKSLEDIGITVFPLYINGVGLSKRIRIIPVLRRLISTSSADIIHVHYSLNALSAFSQASLPIVLSLLGDELLISHVKGVKRVRAIFMLLLTQIIAFRADRVIVKSDEMKQKLWRKRDVFVLSNGINLDMFSPLEKNTARQSLGLSLDKTYILFPGSRNRPQKNFPLAKEAFDITSSRGIDNAELLTLESVPPEQVPCYMNAVDAVLFTSVMEGSPNVIKEAMACNVPIVTVDVGDTRKVVEGTRQCWVTSHEPQEIAQRLIDVLTRGEPSNGRERIQEYDQRIVASRLVDIYRQAIAQSH